MITFGFWIIEENLQTVNKVSAVEGITADADAQRLAKANFGGLVDSLVGQGARTRDDANLALRVNVTGHDANFAFARLDDARAVRSNETRLVLTHETVLHLDHVQLRDSLGDADNQRDLRI